MTVLPFHASVPLARRQLFSRRGRGLAGVLGIAVALLLVLALKAIFAGMEERLTRYIESTGADVVVAQEGVTTMHMTDSALAAEAVAAIAHVPGVSSAEGVVYRSAFVEAGPDDKGGLIQLIGGGPIPRLVAGSRPVAGEIVLDRVQADRLGSDVGDAVRVLGAPLRISGEVEGMASITGSFAFTPRSTLERLLHTPNVVSYVLVRGKPGTESDELAARINRDIPGVTATTRERFAASERRVVGDMTTDIVRAMILVGFVIGVSVAGLVAYSQTRAQLRDFGILRAIGLRARRAAGLVVAQVTVLVIAGFILALALAALLAVLLPALSPTLVLAIRAGDVAQVAAVAGAVTLAASLMPILHVVRVDPASAFRRAS